MNLRTVTVLIMFVASTLSIAQDVQPPANPAAAAVIDALAKSHPVAFSKTFGQEEWYYYIGDEQQFSEFLELYAAIQQPQRQLVIDGKWNAISDQPVAPFRYDWALSVPSGTGQIADPNKQYPAVYVSANSDRLAWRYMVIPESLTIVPPAPATSTDKAKSAVSSIMDAAAWSKAVAAWNELAARELARIAKEEGRQSPQWIEVRSRELSQWLPEYRVFVLETNREGRPSTYAVDKAGTIFTLGSGEWGRKAVPRRNEANNAPYKNEKLTNFLAVNHLKISNSDEAISLTRMVVELTSARNTLVCLKINTKGFRVLDHNIYGSLNDGDRDWRYTAAREKGCWVVTPEYVGGPACIADRNQTHLIVDSNDTLTDIEGREMGYKWPQTKKDK